MKIGILLILLQDRKEIIKLCKNGQENKFTKKNYYNLCLIISMTKYDCKTNLVNCHLPAQNSLNTRFLTIQSKKKTFFVHVKLL